jgi:hypothetical protein
MTGPSSSQQVSIAVTFYAKHREVPSLNLSQLFNLKFSVVLLSLSGYMPE